MLSQYQFAACRIPEIDLSGEFGHRILRLLATQVDRTLDVLGERSGAARLADVDVAGHTYAMYLLGGNALALAVLARCRSRDIWPEAGDDELFQTAADMLRALTRMHELGGGEGWKDFGVGRVLYHSGLAACLLGDYVNPETQELLARELEHRTDRFLEGPAPAQLRDDTQAESNAWHGGGIATVACALQHHPHRDLWERKALEYTISAYATEEDVRSDHIVDGRPLREWLTGPNALADHTVENHGFVHPDYLVSISEMARAVLAYALVGRPIPQGLTFNAGAVFDRLVALTLPDTSHLYVQGTDYTARRVDGLWQACLIALMEPTPLRTAIMLRSLDRLESMAEQWPTLPIHGWLGMPCDLGVTWGLTQNYLAARIFGVGEEAVEDSQIEECLAGTHVSEDGQFVVHRSERSVTSFSWHSDDERGHMLGLSMPLARDTLCYPMRGSWFGDVARAAGSEDEPALGPCELRWRDGGNVVVSLQRCGGVVVQHCASISLPDGGEVFLSELEARADVSLTRVMAGTVWLFDDLRWPWQDTPRSLVGAPGALEPGVEPHATTWINVDDRLGWAVLGAEKCVVQAVEGHPTIFREDVPMYDTLRVDFLPAGAGNPTLRSGERCSRFGMVIHPGLSTDQTRLLVGAMSGWLEAEPGVPAFEVEGTVFFANLSKAAVTLSGRAVDPWTCGALNAT